jgi:3-dehydro-L-gulonate 2-dehydrogenase
LNTIMLRVPYQELLSTLARVLLELGFEPERAQLCARLFAETTLDGVYSHGLNRFPRFVNTIRNGSADCWHGGLRSATVGLLQPSYAS